MASDVPAEMILPDPRQRPTLRVKEAAALLDISLAYEAVHRGELPVIRIGRRILVPTAALMAMVGLKSEPLTTEDTP